MTTLRLLSIACLSLIGSIAAAVQPNDVNQWIPLFVVDGDGAPVPLADLNTALNGDVSVWYKTTPTTAENVTTLSVIGSDTAGHSDNTARSWRDGCVKVAMPDAPWAAGSAEVWIGLDFSESSNPEWCVAGGFHVERVGYGLQEPDSGSGQLARADDLAAVKTVVDGAASASSVATIENYIENLQTSVDGVPTNAEFASGLSPLATGSALTTVGTNVSTVVTQTTASAIRTGLGLSTNNLDTQLAAKASQSSVTALGSPLQAGSYTAPPSTAAIVTAIYSSDDVTQQIADARNVAAQGSIASGSLAEQLGVIANDTGVLLPTAIDEIDVGSVELTEEDIEAIADAVAGEVGTISAGGPVMLAEADEGFVVDASRRRDGVLVADQPIYLTYGETPTCGVSLAKLFPKTRFTAMEAPTSSDTDVVTVSAVATTGYGAEPQIAKFKPEVADEDVADLAKARITFFATTRGSGRQQFAVDVKVRRLAP